VVARALVLPAVLAGCASPVVVAHAPHAGDPVCGVVLQRAPVDVAGLSRRTTTSQGSRAWGSDHPVVLRCGVEPPGPSPERCVRIAGDDGSAVDWLAIEDDDAWTFVTYGRSPAVEVTVPRAASTEAGQPTAVLVDLAHAVSATAVRRTCL
jgi:hypothetical protein